MPQKLSSEIAVIGIDIGKNSFHLVGQDRRGGKTCCISFAGGVSELSLFVVSATRPFTRPNFSLGSAERVR
jgi:hypothetical protein